MKTLKLLLSSLILAGCILTISACRETPPPFEDTNWTLTQYGEEANLKNVLPDTEVSAFFDSKEKMVMGSGGCNSYSAPYTVEHLTLTIAGPVTMTKKFCGGDIGMQEDVFINALKKAERYELTQGRLTIYCGGTVLLFDNTGATVKPAEFR